MEQNQKPAKPSQQDPEQGNEIDPRQKQPYGAEGYRSGIDDPGAPTRKNPGHTNPAHNTPGQIRQDQPGQEELGQPGQGETQSYPGIKGPKARELQQDSAIDEKNVRGVIGEDQIKGGVEKNVGTVQRKGGSAKDDALDMPKE